MPKLEPLIATSVRYLSQNDETAFFEWLNRMECVAGVEGSGIHLFIDLKRTPNDDDLRDLVAFFHRYKVDMRQLARFDRPQRQWFRNPEAFWYGSVFADAPASE